MKRLAIKISIIVVILITVMVALSGCFYGRYPKVPKYGAVQSRFCDCTDMDKWSTNAFGIDFAFKNKQFEANNIKADLYFGCTEDSFKTYGNNYLSVLIMAIECKFDEPYEKGDGEIQPTVLFEGRKNELTQEEYREYIDNDIIELKTNNAQFKTYKKQVFFEIPFEKFCNDYIMDRVESRGYFTEFKYNKCNEITISDTLLQEGNDRSVLFVALGTRKRFNDTNNVDLPMLGYVRIKYKLSDNIVEVSV